MRKRYTGKEQAPLNVQNAKAEPRAVPREIQNEGAHMIKNGLNQDILGFAPGTGFGSQLSQVDTLFKNNRWYLISNMRQLLCEIYVEHGIIQRVVDMPVDDGLRGGIIIKSKQLSEEQVQQVRVYMDRQNDVTIVGQALKWNRLFGGAGLVMITGKEPREPLNIASLTKDAPFELRAVDMWELFWDQQNIEGYVPELQQFDFEYYTYYSKKLHRSHVMPMKGLTAPSFIRPRLRGWGFSVVESLVRSINQYLKATDLSFEVLDEFKLDVFKFKGLVNTLGSPQGAIKVKERVDLANRGKNYQNALVLDSEDDFDHKQLSFSGLAETMTGIRMQLASDMCMPMSKLFGISSTGFSSGEDDIENYNAMVESQVRQKCKYDFVKLVEIRCQQLFGFIPEDLEIEFKPLRVLGAEAEENVKTQKFNRLLAASTAGAIDPKEFRLACNRDNLLGIQLDTEIDLVDQDDAEEGARDVTGTDAGANAPDKEKPQLAAKTPGRETKAKSTTEAKEAPEAKT